MPTRPWGLRRICGTDNLPDGGLYHHASKSPTSSKATKGVRSGAANRNYYPEPPHGSSYEVQNGRYSSSAPRSESEVVPSKPPGAFTLPRTKSYLEHQEHQEHQRNQPASSSDDHRNGRRQDDVYLTQAPPTGSYQDDDSGPSPKNLLMAVTGVKNAVNYFAKKLMSDMKGHEELKRLIDRDGNAQVERANHSKFLVQAFLCKRFFEGFDRENGFYGLEAFDNRRMSSINSFVDFTKFKDKAETISWLLSKDLEDESFLGQFCFKKFKSICGDAVTDQPLSIYGDDWKTVSKKLHPKSEFYRSYLKVAVSVWLLHRLAHSFEQEWKMLTYSKGHAFDSNLMESVVPGGCEEEGVDGDVNLSVGFSVIPGFKVSRSIVKCEVYVRNNRNDGKIMETPDKTSRDKIPVIQKTPESVRTSGDRNRVQETVAVHGNYWIEPIVRNQIKQIASAVNNNSGGISRKNPNYSPGSREQPERNDHAATSHFLPHVARHTALSKSRELATQQKKLGRSSPNGGSMPNRGNIMRKPEY